jgi:uncharacterized protein (TIGR02145 family)
MKTKIFALIFLLIVKSTIAQYTLSIQKSDGTDLEVSTSQINKIVFYPACPGTPTVTYAGHTYNTVQIGTQCWLKENLNVGTIVINSTNQTGNNIIEKYCYNDDSTNCSIYGGLYQWNEAMAYSSTEGARGICPTGWHIPSKAEFQTLSTNVGDSGNALKAVGQGTGSGAGTNSSGFSALYTWFRVTDGGWSSSLNYLNVWSSTKATGFGSANSSDIMYLLYDDDVIHNLSSMYNEFGLSVRCIKD